MATNPKGETCLHIAAKNGHSSCVVRLLSSRINTPGAATRLADLVFAEGLDEVKYVDLHNLAGMTALHVATLNGSAATVQAVLASGASVDAQITGSNLTPWLSRGSTALHIAAARGFHAVVDVLLASHSPEAGTLFLGYPFSGVNKACFLINYPGLSSCTYIYQSPCACC